MGITDLNKIKECVLKEKITRKYNRRIMLILKSNLNGRNKITAMNIWGGGAAVLRYGARILDLKYCKLKRLDRTTRKTMKIYVAFYPKSDVD